MARRLACDATLIVALDDELGHTMYEGRAQRFPTDTQRREVWRRDRHCVFPGCHHVLFTNCHHIDEWEHGGLTDLDNLALMCEHHHHLIHSKLWAMTGDANVELEFVGPSGQVMTTRPSRLWARVSDPTVLAEGRARAKAKAIWGSSARSDTVRFCSLRLQSPSAAAGLRPEFSPARPPGLGGGHRALGLADAVAHEPCGGSPVQGYKG